MRNWPAIGLPRLIAAGVVLPVTLAVLTHLHPPFLGAVAPVLAVGALVLLAGRPIGDLSQGALRRQVALVSDDPPILRGSLRRALSLGIAPRPDDATLSKTAGRFGLGQLLAARGGGDQVAEGGRDLSGGQRLLVAATRAALGAPGLVLLDATPEALDADARQAVSSWLTGLDATIIAADPGHGWPFDYAQELRLSTAPAK